MESVAESRVGIEEVEGWAEELERVHARIAGRFVRAEPRRRVGAYLRGLLSAVERKNGWQLAEELGESTPDGVQRLLATARWDAGQVRDDLREYVVEHLGDPAAVLVVDETGFVKKGTESAGVQRQYSGTAGRVENCQIGVFLAYASVKGRTLLDRELYLPESWTRDRPRCNAAGIPQETAFATKPRLAEAMLGRAFAADVPAQWVTGDAVYGSNRAFRGWLITEQHAFVLAVRSDEQLALPDPDGGPIWSAEAGAVGRALPAEDWQRLSVGAGAKGLLVDDWAWLPLADQAPAGWAHWVLLRRRLSDPDEVVAYHVFGPRATTLLEAARVAVIRWAIEECFETAKGEVGLDEYEVRKWDSWYRHITLVMLAHAYLTVIRAAAQTAREGEAACHVERAQPARMGSVGASHGARSAPVADTPDLDTAPVTRPDPALVALAAATPGPRQTLPLR
jgi:SRSO17 transposase